MHAAKPSPAAAEPSADLDQAASALARPSPDLVRAVTDEQVLWALLRHRRLTRAGLAAETGVSKPTAGESVRRLTDRGLVADTGERTPGGRGRGRVGSYYSLAPALGVALAVTIAPEGVVVEGLDVYGDTLARVERPVDRPARPDQVAAALASAAAEVGDTVAQSVRVAVVSAADPVDRATGRLVQLPDAPFLVGSLDPVAILTPYAAQVIVDNDVNWAATAELGSSTAPESVGASRPDLGLTGLRDFAYLHLGEGLGCAIVNDGEIRRGRSGLTGEIAHLLTTGPGGAATRFIEVFAHLGLRRDGTTAIDVDRLYAAIDVPGAREVLVAAAAGVVAAVIALADPQEVVVGGSWGPALVDDLRAAVDRMPRNVSVRAAALTSEPVLAGVRTAALRHLRATVLTP